MTTTDQRSEVHRAISAEYYLRGRYGAYKAHPAWRELEDAFNAGFNVPRNIVSGNGIVIDLEAMRLRLELAESVTMPKANAVALLDEIERLRAALQPAAPTQVETQGCSCEWCQGLCNGGIQTRMAICPECGNKRCPKATNHANACTGSNAIGQPGSSWEHVKPFAPSQGG